MGGESTAGLVPGKGAVEYLEEIPAVAEFSRLLDQTRWFCDEPPSPEALSVALGASWAAVCARSAGRLVGTGRIVSDGALHALIVDVIVDEEWQGRGVGTGIMTRLVAACERAGVRDVQLFCAVGKRPFYERLGFTARPVDAPGMQLGPVT